MNNTNTPTQQMLFPEMENNITHRKFQIKRFCEPCFGITMDIAEDEDPETTALEQLGYFVVPQAIV